MARSDFEERFYWVEVCDLPPGGTVRGEPQRPPGWEDHRPLVEGVVLGRFGWRYLLRKDTFRSFRATHLDILMRFVAMWRL